MGKCKTNGIKVTNTIGSFSFIQHVFSLDSPNESTDAIMIKIIVATKMQEP